MANKLIALQKYHFDVVDENDNPIVSGLRVSVFSAGSTNATIYSDQYATALTNPITSTVFDTAVGQIEFWHGSPAVDVVINDGIGRMVKIESLTPSQNRIVFDSRQAVSGSLGNITGTDLADASGAFVDYSETVVIDGTLLRAGDVIEIDGLVVIDDYNSTDTLDIKIYLGDTDAATTALLLHTGDMSLVNDNDYLRFSIKVRVRTSGTSGKIIWDALAWTNIAGTLALKNCTVEDGVSLAGASLNMSDDLTIKAQGDYSVSHADNESQVLFDVRVIKGVAA